MDRFYLIMIFLLSKIEMKKKSDSAIGIIDAGSSGSRIYIYKYETEESSGKIFLDTNFESLKVADKLSSFENNPYLAGTSIEPLLNFYIKAILKFDLLPEDCQIYLKATGGLRQIENKDVVDKILFSVNEKISEYPFKNVSSSDNLNFIHITKGIKSQNYDENFLRYTEGYRSDKNSSINHLNYENINTKDSSFVSKIILGHEEGLFGWLSLNYLFDTNELSSFGLLELGGSSFQIAFELDEVKVNENSNINNNIVNSFNKESNKSENKIKEKYKNIIQNTEICKIIEFDYIKKTQNNKINENKKHIKYKNLFRFLLNKFQSLIHREEFVRENKRVLSCSFPLLGLQAIQEEFIKFSDFEKAPLSYQESGVQFLHPCYPKGFRFSFKHVLLLNEDVFKHKVEKLGGYRIYYSKWFMKNFSTSSREKFKGFINEKKVEFVGSGDFEKCTLMMENFIGKKKIQFKKELDLINEKLINSKKRNLKERFYHNFYKILFDSTFSNTKHRADTINSNNKKRIFYAIENFFYTTEFFGLQYEKEFVFDKLNVMGKEFCNTRWNSLQKKYMNEPLYDLKKYCFSSIYLNFIVKNFLGFGYLNNNNEKSSDCKNFKSDYSLNENVCKRNQCIENDSNKSESDKRDNNEIENHQDSKSNREDLKFEIRIRRTIKGNEINWTLGSAFFDLVSMSFNVVAKANSKIRYVKILFLFLLFMVLFGICYLIAHIIGYRENRARKFVKLIGMKIREN